MHHALSRIFLHTAAALLLGLVGLLGLPQDASAQRRDTTVVLPDIAPREVEIRGRLEIAFPSLRRQPLVGFNPPPRIPTLPVDRLPYIGDYKQQTSDLPGTPLRRPEAPPALSGAAYPPANGEVATWIGRYFSRGARLAVEAPVADVGLVSANVHYEGTDGHHPDPDDADLHTPSDVVGGDFQFARHGTRWVAALHTEGYYESYTVFAAERIDPNLIPEPVRKGGGGAGTLILRNVASPNVAVEGHLRYGGYKYQTRRFLNAETPGALLVRSQQHLDAGIELDIPLTRSEAWVQGGFEAVGLGSDLDATSAGFAGIGLTFSRPTWRARLGGQFLGSFIDDPSLPTEESSVSRAAPDVLLEFFPRPGVRLYAKNSPHIELLRLDEQYRDNPYLVTQPRTEASLHWLDAEGGLQFYAGVFQIGLRGGLRDVRQFRYLTEATFADGLDGYLTSTFFAPRYADARIVHVGGDVSVVLPGQVHLALGASYRDGTLRAIDGFIPYFADVVGHGTVSFSFAESQGLLQITGTYEGPRPLDPENTVHIGPVVDVDTELSYNLGNHLGILAHIRNISFGFNEEWRRYPFPPAVFGGGLRLFW